MGHDQIAAGIDRGIDDRAGGIQCDIDAADFPV